jgi:large subunit ribosomal protein L3
MAEEVQTIKAEELSPQPFGLKAILGQKVGMTHIFTDHGEIVPVSVVFTGGCVATAVRTPEKDGYAAVQRGMGDVKEKNMSQALLGQFKKANVAPKRWLKEFRVQDAAKFSAGQKVKSDIFKSGDYVDVSGTTIGKGFAGVMKRHNFSGLPASHGASDKERSPGSSGGGSGQPQRVLKGTRMAGRLGGAWCTAQKMEVVKVDAENDLILIKGTVPGVARNLLVVQETSKHIKHKRAPIAQAKSVKKTANVKGGVKPAPTGKPAAAPAKK